MTLFTRLRHMMETAGDAKRGEHASANTYFTRSLYNDLIKQLKKRFPNIQPAKVGVTCTKIGNRKFYFFQYQGFNYDCTADDAWEARYKGWLAWARKHGMDLEDES